MAAGAQRLVAAGIVAPAISPDLDRRFGGLARLYGSEGAQKIREAHVVVVGLGGVGSWAAEALARSGVGALTLIDLDHIAESNINRQVHALDTTLGQAKVLAMRERILHINPGCNVRCVEEFVEPDNWPGIAGLNGFSDRALAIIDACDQVKAKTAMAAWAIQINTKAAAADKVHFISAGAAGGKRHAHKVAIEDLSLVTHDPLLAQLRYRLRKEEGAARVGQIGLACVFSAEKVVRAGAVLAPADNAVPDVSMPDKGMQTDSSLNCHGYGSVVSVTSTFGVCAAGWLLSKIAG
jgi:tRNA A37 threonylcarbamoyladenosine dehydratase